MKLLSFLFNISRSMVILAVVASAISGISSIGLIAIINTTLNNTTSTPGQTLIWSFVGLALLRLITLIFSRVLLVYLGQDAIFDLRLRLSRRILASPLRHLEKIGPHRLLATLTNDTAAITSALLNVPILCLNIAIVAGGLAYLAWLSRSVFLAAVGFIILGVITYQLPVTAASRFFKRTREEQDALFRHFRALTEGIKELQLHFRRRETFLTRLLYETASAVKRHFLLGMSLYTVASSWGNLLFFIFIGLLLFVLPVSGEGTVQNLTGYTLTVLYMMTPLQAILTALPSLSQANVALQKLETLDLSLVNVQFQERAAPKPVPFVSWNRLELKGVTHTYHREREDDHFTLGPIHLTFHPGELVFLVGGNGSGKTTLAKLLTGLYTPESGEIRLDAQPITQENRERYRQNFSAVFSDFYLFESLLGLESSELDGRARDYLIQLQLDHKVQAQNGHLSTTDLSRGQRKRLALLVAYLEDRPFYVFDEWAAEQDPLFREIFYTQTILELKKRNKAVLVITHDEQYYHLADRIIKLDYGQIKDDVMVDIRS